MATNLTSGGAIDASIDPDAGGIFNGKPIWDVDQIDANLNRSGYDFYTNNYGELDDGVLNFGYWLNIEELQNSYYVNATGSIAFNEAYYADDFSAFNAGQMGLASSSISLWDDVVSIGFRETKSGNADITFGNTSTGGAQAYAYLPFGSTNDAAYSAVYDFDEAGRLGGDVWIDGFVASNFSPLFDSYYAKTTMVHEIGHAIGLSHPGDYNATDDDDGDGVADPITYENDAFYAQDSRQYSIMSYFDAYETGAQHIDFTLLNFAYAATPLVHDVSAIQAIYGVDTTTRTGNTTYGFNSTAGEKAFDFTVNTRPIVTIWDAGGVDTLDFSGWNTDSVIDLNEGAFSSGGGIEAFLTLEEVNANRAELGFAPRTQATFDFYEDLKAQYGITSGLFTDNVSIAYGAVIENATGGAGDDLFIVNAARNLIKGGAGNDTVSYETSTTGVLISFNGGLGSGGAAGDNLKNIENLIGSNFDDRLGGSSVANILDGGTGNDTLIGQGGADTFVLRTSGASGVDRVTDFGRDDFIVTDKAIDGVDGNGVVMANRNGSIVLDATDGDTLIMRNVADYGGGLKFVSEVDGMFYYSAVSATVNPLTFATTTANMATGVDGPVRPTDGGTVYGGDDSNAQEIVPGTHTATPVASSDTLDLGKGVEMTQGEAQIGGFSAAPAAAFAVESVELFGFGHVQSFGSIGSLEAMMDFNLV